ncbi:hypothetical protein N9068_01605 [bacterium]|nr:hypothetical protein [bacterium]
MFTDVPGTPLHLESLVVFLRENSQRSLSSRDIRDSFQPPTIHHEQDQSENTIRAIEQLNLGEIQAGIFVLADCARGRKPVRQAVLEAMDEHVLGKLDVEPFLALFYAYMLGQNGGTTGKNREEWVLAFNRDVFNNVKQNNQFNPTKLTGLHRWISYMGLGWYDPKGEFQCAPFERLQRRLSMIFQKQKKLECDEFMHRLSEACPELDGGKIFLEGNKSYDANAKQCTLGLSHALVDLHLGGFIKLHCPKDSAGWSIALANPPNDGKTLASNRFSQVELGKGGKK